LINNNNFFIPSNSKAVSFNKEVPYFSSKYFEEGFLNSIFNITPSELF
jgi:hypothetical protein